MRESKSSGDDNGVLFRVISSFISASTMKVGKVRVKLEPSVNWEHPE